MLAEKIDKGTSISERDKMVIWHPYTQQKKAPLPIAIVKGEGAYLYDDAGKRYIDGISSWWVNAHGHAHPHISKKISEQLQKLEHTMFAGFTHEPAVSLAERLLKILPSNQKKVFYSDNGSTAVEVAVKMALQYWNNKGQQRKKIIAFNNGFHGDTFGAMSVSGRGVFNSVFKDQMFDVSFIDVPFSSHEQNSLNQLKDLLKAKDVAAFIFEPLIQGAAGMKMYEAKALDSMLSLCKEEDVLCIADEVMTGFGRTGKMFASDALNCKPDMICLSKALTGGYMPMGVTTCTNAIYDAFLFDDVSKTFFHGHSYTANPIACVAALASLDVFDEKETFENINRIESSHHDFVQKVKGHFKLIDVRSKGIIMALELKVEKEGYLSSVREKLYSYFIQKGVILRPLGNIIYVLPPHCIEQNDLNYIYESILEFIEQHEF